MFTEKPFPSTLHFWSRIFLPEFGLAYGPGESTAGSGSEALGDPFQLLSGGI